MKKVKKVEIASKVFGIILMVLSLVLSYAEQFPCILKRISPEHVRGMRGLEKLIIIGATLKPCDCGFSDLSKIVMRWQKDDNPSKNFSTIQVEIFKRMGGMTAKHRGEQVDLISAVVYDLSDGSGGCETISSLRIGLDQIHLRNVFFYMAAFLLIGILFVEAPTIIILFIQR